MYFLRASALPKIRRRDKRNIYDQSNSSQENFQRIRHPSPGDERDNIKVGTDCWIRLYECSSQSSHEGSSAGYQFSRLSSKGQKYFSKSSLKKRIAGITCFHYRHHTSHLDRSIPSPVLRPHTSEELHQDKICVSEVIREKPSPKHNLRINAKPSSYHSINDLSPILSFSDDNELHAVRPLSRKTKKPRKLTQYHDPDNISIRKQSKACCYSSQRVSGESVRGGTSKGLATGKSAVGRHLEWLKFMA